MASCCASLTAPRSRLIMHSVLSVASYVLITLVAALPRILDLGRFVTVDEASFWMQRSQTFVAALQHGDFAATAIATQPGVTTMWLGGSGHLLYDALQQWGVITDTSFRAYLMWQQLPVALAHTMGVIIGYMLLRRLFTPITALLAAVLWATDPFVIGYSRVLHVDMLTGTFLTVSLLAACVYWHHERRWSWLALSAVCGGLAMLSKIPGIIIVPIFMGLALLALRWPMSAPVATTNEQPPATPCRTLLRTAIRPLALWSTVLVATLLIAWPAIWANPAGVYDMLRFGVVNEGGEPHATGNFFLGQAIVAPGPLFYPVALALRTTPWTLLGVFLLPVAYWSWPRAARRTVVTLITFVLLFMVGISASPKKFNRYLVPAFPAVDIIAAAGMVGFGRKAQRLIKSSHVQYAVPAAVLTVVAVTSAANDVYWRPYGIDAYNQILGGAMAGSGAFLTGWGEGLEQAAEWLNQQPDITGVTVASTLVDPLQRYLRPGAQAYTPGAAFTKDTGYVVVYIRNMQDPVIPAPFDQFVGKVAPLHVITIHGVPYAWVYQMPPTIAHPQAATFGTRLQFYGFDGDMHARAGEAIRLKLWWKARQTPQQAYRLFAHLLTRDGQRVAQVDLPYTMTDGEAQHFVARELVLPLPANTPSGTYALTIGLYDPATGQRLALITANSDNRAADGDDAFKLGEVQVGP